MVPSLSIQTFEIFGKTLEYDPLKLYGMFDAQGKYTRIDVGKKLPQLATDHGQQGVMEFLVSNIYRLKGKLPEIHEQQQALDSLIQSSNIHTTDSNTPNVSSLERRNAMLNTIDLFEYIVETLKE